jgi:DNA-directed RNA polymerase subunit RPC12/RpoP
MLILKGACPKCKGNLILNRTEQSLTCEDCSYKEITKDKKAFIAALEETEEWGPKEKRLVPSAIGKLFLEPYSGLAEYLRETLQEGIKGLDLEEEEIKLLKKYKLLEDENGKEERRN